MGKLSNIRPALPSITGRLRYTDREGHSRALEPWRAWYNTGRWRALRKAILLRDAYTCQADGCDVAGAKGMVVDHREPHRGDARRFWAEGNLQTLCPPCHNAAKQREEQASRHLIGVWD